MCLRPELTPSIIICEMQIRTLYPGPYGPGCSVLFARKMKRALWLSMAHLDEQVVSPPARLPLNHKNSYVKICHVPRGRYGGALNDSARRMIFLWIMMNILSSPGSRRGLS